MRRRLPKPAPPTNPARVTLPRIEFFGALAVALAQSPVDVESYVDGVLAASTDLTASEIATARFIMKQAVSFTRGETEIVVPPSTTGGELLTKCAAALGFGDPGDGSWDATSWADKQTAAAPQLDALFFAAVGG